MAPLRSDQTSARSRLGGRNSRRPIVIGPDIAAPYGQTLEPVAGEDGRRLTVTPGMPRVTI